MLRSGMLSCSIDAASFCDAQSPTLVIRKGGTGGELHQARAAAAGAGPAGSASLQGSALTGRGCTRAQFKFERVLDNVTQDAVYAVRSLNGSGLQVPRWPRSGCVCSSGVKR